MDVVAIDMYTPEEVNLRKIKCWNSVGPARTCVGSACMGWRWETKKMTVDNPLLFTEETFPRERTGRGYCGAVN